MKVGNYKAGGIHFNAPVIEKQDNPWIFFRMRMWFDKKEWI